MANMEQSESPVNIWQAARAANGDAAKNKLGAAIDTTVDDALTGNGVDLTAASNLFISAYKGAPNVLTVKHSQETTTFNDGSTLTDTWDKGQTTLKADEKIFDGLCDQQKDEGGPSSKKAVECMEENHGAIVFSKSVATNGADLTFDSHVEKKALGGVVYGEQSYHHNRTLQAGANLKLVDAFDEKGASITISHSTGDGGTNQIEFVPPRYGSKEKPVLHAVQFVDAAGKTQTKILDQQLQ